MPKLDPQKKDSTITNDLPYSYKNWEAAIDQEPIYGSYEHPMFTDARITGEVSEGYGPYQFINTIPDHYQVGFVQPSIILRYDYHLKIACRLDEIPIPNMDKTNPGYYHGGYLADEIAALVSLCLGVRFKTGKPSREYIGKDTKGRPLAWPKEPILQIGNRSLILPQATGEHSLGNLELLKSFPALDKTKVIALIRAARLYQDAIWMVESEPSSSWLMLVSAVETAALHWDKSEYTPVEKLKTSKSELFNYLESKGIPDLTSEVADHLADSFGSTSKFTKFLIKFLPEPPPIRPPEWNRILWKNRFLKEAFRKIYDHRSKALHSGIPFPPLMCKTPLFRESRDKPAFTLEKPCQLASCDKGGVWLQEDTPMFFHVFEYIVRNALINWWIDGSNNNH